MSGLISVLMPVLNEESTLEDALASVLGQRDVQVEVLVIDGCSKDRTVELAAAITDRDPRVRVFINERTSIAAGLNVGLAVSRGEFIARVDGHSTVDDDYLHRAVTALDANPNMAAIGGKRIGVSDSPVGRAIALALSSRFGGGNSINHYSNTAQLTDHASFGVYRRGIVLAVGGWDESLLVNEDVDFDHRILAPGFDIGYDPEMQLRWHVRKRIVDLFRQYRRYGRGKAAMIRKNGREAIRWRHLVPPLAVVAAAAVLLASARYPVLLLLFTPYLALVIGASLVGWRRREPDVPTSAAAIPAAFVAMHSAWGLGFVEGFVFGLAPALSSGDSATAKNSTHDVVSTAGPSQRHPRAERIR